MSDEEVVDPMPLIQEDCKNSHHCHSIKDKFEECNIRVTNADGSTEETCVEEFFDLMECVDHCASDKIFATLK
ncbi:hypothetical protein HK099_005124 [Clydaea vesicula]|uniref:Cytochrome b-c1 complex subunit 6 n=1 Tax=Clydaea vesicula TaxID=447962 RepID=A0AAD5TZC6_9FUNG|nr:hypothetical protein HK099_005124 [Clydaea vesicula]KAJ3395648.1 hypothetical protein HDU92_005274 [Lobulomyces angularis]